MKAGRVNVCLTVCVSRGPGGGRPWPNPPNSTSVSVLTKTPNTRLNNFNFTYGFSLFFCRLLTPQPLQEVMWCVRWILTGLVLYMLWWFPSLNLCKPKLCPQGPPGGGGGPPGTPIMPSPAGQLCEFIPYVSTHLPTLFNLPPFPLYCSYQIQPTLVTTCTRW